MPEHWIREFLDPRRDIDHLDGDIKWYKEMARGSRKESNKAIFYMAARLVRGMCEHFGRGAIAGGLAGMISTGSVNGMYRCALLGGLIDCDQYVIRAMLKIRRAYD